MTAARVCPECGTPIPPDAHRARRFCSDACRYRYRDARRDWTTSEIREADARRHRERYAARLDRPIRPYRRKDAP